MGLKRALLALAANERGELAATLNTVFSATKYGILCHFVVTPSSATTCGQVYKYCHPGLHLSSSKCHLLKQSLV